MEKKTIRMDFSPEDLATISGALMYLPSAPNAEVEKELHDLRRRINKAIIDFEKQEE